MSDSKVRRPGAPRLTALALSLLSLPAVARAAHPLVTDDSGTVGRGTRQLELTAEALRDREVAGGVNVAEAGGGVAATLTLGVTDRLDVAVGAPFGWTTVRESGVTVSDAAGLGDVSVELKWRLLEGRGFSLAVKPGVSLPTGDEHRGLGTGAAGYRAALIVSQELGPFAVHLNGAYARNELALEEDRLASRRDLWHASLAASAAVRRDLLAVANVGVETNADRASRAPPAFALAGLIYSPSESLDLDAGVKVGLNRQETDLTALAGLTSRF